MSNPQRNPTSHGHSGDAKSKPVPDHKSYGGDQRNEVAGGPAGRGNDTTSSTVNTGRDWGRGDRQEGDDRIPEADKPVADKSGGPNVFGK